MTANNANCMGMGNRLLKLIQQYVATEKGAVPKLAAAVSKDTQTIRRWIKAERIPESSDRVAVALQCGCTLEEARELAQELPEAKGKAS